MNSPVKLPVSMFASVQALFILSGSFKLYLHRVLWRMSLQFPNGNTHIFISALRTHKSEWKKQFAVREIFYFFFFFNLRALILFILTNPKCLLRRQNFNLTSEFITVIRYVLSQRHHEPLFHRAVNEASWWLSRIVLWTVLYAGRFFFRKNSKYPDGLCKGEDSKELRKEKMLSYC